MNNIYLFYVLGVFLMVVSCNEPAERNDDEKGRASIHPSITTLETGESVSFKVVKLPEYMQPATLAENVIWSVNGVVGGNRETGTIDENGLYTAPEEIPSPHTLHIGAEVDGVQNKQLFATVMMAPDEPCYESVFQYTEPVKESEYFGVPHSIAFDKDGNLVILDDGKHHAVRFTPEGEFSGYIGDGPGQREGQFIRPRDVVLGPDDKLYICDQREFGDRIQVFTNDGKFERSFGPPGHDPGRVLRCHGMDFDTHGNLHVIDVDNFRVTLFIKGRRICRFVGRGCLSHS